MEASLLYKSFCTLAEGPFWHSSRKSFFWLDIEGKCLYEYNWNSKLVVKKSLPFRASMIVENQSGNLILGAQGGLAFYSIELEKLSWFLDVEKESPDQRCNDGKCDLQGRLWFGTMDISGKEAAGSLYCLDTNLNLTKKLENLTIPNGIAWSLDKKRFYHVDSPSFSVKSYFFEISTGTIRFEKIAISIPKEMGLPDGIAMDEEGMLWIAHYGGHGVYRWNPKTGALLDKIEVPVPLVTSCAFGGENFDHLIITSANNGLNKEELDHYPLSGCIFVAEPGVKGSKLSKFGS